MLVPRHLFGDERPDELAPDPRELAGRQVVLQEPLIHALVASRARGLGRCVLCHRADGANHICHQPAGLGELGAAEHKSRCTESPVLQVDGDVRDERQHAGDGVGDGRRQMRGCCGGHEDVELRGLRHRQRQLARVGDDSRQRVASQ